MVPWDKPILELQLDTIEDVRSDDVRLAKQAFIYSSQKISSAKNYQPRQWSSFKESVQNAFFNSNHTSSSSSLHTFSSWLAGLLEGMQPLEQKSSWQAKQPYFKADKWHFVEKLTAKVTGIVGGSFQPLEFSLTQ